MKFISLLINIQCFFIYCKYFSYFILFLNILLINTLFYKISNSHSKFLTTLLYKTINLNGCVLIKFIQWILSNIELLDLNINESIINLFSNVYENCHVHSLEYSKYIFKKQLNCNFDDVFEIVDNNVIKSGSIAQIYHCKIKNIELLNINISNVYNEVAVKIVHPEIKFQILFPKYFIKLYSVITKNIFFLKKYDNIFDYDNFFTNLEKQSNMNIEYDNNNYYYQEYLNNEIFIIPKPILSSSNVLLLEYIEGNKLDELNISDFEKQKLVLLMSLFCKNNYLYLNYFHADLHDSNWKIVNQNNSYKIVIYDFGYVIKNDLHEFFRKLTLYTDMNSVELIGDILYDSIINIKIDKFDFINNLKNYLNTEYIMYTSVNLTKYIYKFCYINKYYTKKNLFEVIMSLLLLKKHMDKYIFFSNIHSASNVLKINTYYYNLCKKYNIFYNIQTFIYDNYLNNYNFTKNIDYNNEYFDNLNNEYFDNLNNNNATNDHIILNIDI